MGSQALPKRTETFGIHQKFKKGKYSFACSMKSLELERDLHLSFSVVSQVCFRSVLGLSFVAGLFKLANKLIYFVLQTEPKILRLV